VIGHGKACSAEAR